MQEVSIVILAAGRSRRFGSAKLAAEIAGASLLQRALETATESDAHRVILVTGSHREALTPLAAGFDVELVYNDNFRDGIGSSIATGFCAVPAQSAAGILLLADQPLVTATHLRALTATWRHEHCDAVATRYAGILGPPVLFAAAQYPALRELSGDIGARRLLRDSRLDVRSVECDAAACDIDTRTDLERLRSAQSSEEK